ncbi:MAG: hypothetical protein AB4042_13460 [Leptolyngbyaceae cyanobacterium]
MLQPINFELHQTKVGHICQRLCLTVLLLSLMLAEGCAAISPLTDWLTSPMIDLTIVQVNSTGGEGRYQVTGRTTLPDQTEITVSAIRALEAIADGTPSYSILDRQIAVVSNGTWETQLNLWRSGPNRQYQEPWQITEGLTTVRFTPLSEVTFAAVLEPKDAAQFRKTVENQDTPALRRIEQYNDDGELYLRATKTQALALPSGQPSSDTPQPLGLYQTSATVERVNVQPSSDLTPGMGPSGSRSDLPLSLDAYLR